MSRQKQGNKQNQVRGKKESFSKDTSRRETNRKEINRKETTRKEVTHKEAIGKELFQREPIRKVAPGRETIVSEPARSIRVTRTKPIELLAPAGSIQCMEAAIRAGADAVYMGGPRFGARAYAENPESDGLVEAIDFIHLHGKKLYLTVNTLLKPEELDGLYEYLLPFYQAGLDGVIVQDMGVVRRIRQLFPVLPVHASTQMTVMDPEGAKALQELGLTRVVTAREITVSEMKAIADTGMELEVFVHGAICYCYSGQCLMSSLIGGRSGNRGRCAQPCRLPYDVIRDGRTLTKPDENYVLNLKDMDTLSCLPEMLEAGVDSLKIEGRMKSPRYTFGVTAVYRKYIDRYLQGGMYQVDAEDRRFLQELFDRGGYTEYASRGLKDHMIATGRKPEFRAADEAFLREKEASFPVNPLKEKIKGSVRFFVNEPVSLTMERTVLVDRVTVVNDKVMLIETPVTVAVTETGDVVMEAQNRPMDEMALRQRFEKLGDTPFVWEELTIETDGQGFLPVGQLNDLRRRAAETLEQEILARYHREVPAIKEWSEDVISHKVQDLSAYANSAHDAIENKQIPSVYIGVDTLPQLKTVLSYPQVDRIYLNVSTMTQSEEETALEWLSKSGKSTEIYINLPPVLRAHMKNVLERRMDRYDQMGVTGFLVHTWDQAAWLRKRMPQCKLQAAFSLYTFNQASAQTMAELGVTGATLPVELNARELAARRKNSPLPSELMIYGYLPVMVSAQCVHRTTEGCNGKPGMLTMVDRMKKQFKVRNCCRLCYNVIYNSEPMSLLDLDREWRAWDLEAVSLQFTLEDEKETRRILDATLAGLQAGQSVANPVEPFTRGHFKRGVE